jgi:hypothetical protein
MDIVTFGKEFGTIIVGAIIFIASFLWKDFLGDFEDMYFPKQHGLWRRFLFVVAVTVILVTIAVYLKGSLGLLTVTDIHFDDTPENDSVSVEEFKGRKKMKYELRR